MNTLTEILRNKFSQYNAEQCKYALADIAATIVVIGGTDMVYVDKLLCERDCALERLAELARQDNTKDRVINKIVLNYFHKPVLPSNAFTLMVSEIEELLGEAYDAGKRSR